MIKEAIATGTTIDDAVAAAKAALQAPEEADVSFEVLEQPQRKTFGLFGGAKAKVRAFYELPDEKPRLTPAPEKKTERQPRPQAEKKAPARPKNEQPAEKRGQDRPAPERAAGGRAEGEKPSGEQKPVGRAPLAPVEYKDIPLGEITDLADYLKAMLAAMGLARVAITAKTAENELFLHVECEDDYGILIGRRGETLDAVQYLLRLFANRNARDYARVSVNVGNYREKRENNLRQLARKTANQVLRYGRQSSLEPMNPYERRLIHTAIQEIQGVTSYSVGSDGERRVVIALQEGFSPSQKGSNTRGGGYNNRDRSRPAGNRPPRNEQPRRDKPKDGQNADQRTAAKDAASVSLYGRIEPKK